MKKKDSQNEKLMFEIAQENKRLSEPLQKASLLPLFMPCIHAVSNSGALFLEPNLCHIMHTVSRRAHAAVVHATVEVVFCAVCAQPYNLQHTQMASNNCLTPSAAVYSILAVQQNAHTACFSWSIFLVAPHHCLTSPAKSSTVTLQE